MIKLKAGQQIKDIDGSTWQLEEGDFLEARRDLPQSPSHVVKKMDNDVYALRKQVMKYIYRAKDLLGGNMPRIDVRITDISPERLRKDSGPLGTAFLKQNYILIPEKTFSDKYFPYMHEIVFHELLHAIYGMPHDENSPLMSSTIHKTPMRDKDVDAWFLKHAKEYK